ncbi:MAG TPA: PP2C family serine/threonine-protein phosphatase [Trebonia sp.]|jgi:protein phosphatase|nr:PP2C family serine/threonine-protein phosphatase [Trebonia sp.]
MTLALRFAVRSDVGLLREGNEDSAYAGPHLLAVADGMGGHAAGEVASSATIDTIAALDTDQPPGGLLNALAGAVANANTRLQEMIVADPATEGMGTTLTALLWSDGHAALCHIGDSRAYLLREGKFYQITHDHTLVQSLVDDGRITEDDVATHPQRSLLLRALDGRSTADPDLSTHDAMPGDRYLLCSDGLSGVVTEQTLHQALSSVRDPDTAALQLVELALKGGGPDNITCIVADVVDTTTTSLPPTRTPVLAGAASAGPPEQLRQNSPAGRAVRLRKTEPQAALPDEADPRWDASPNGNGDRTDITYAGGAPTRPTGQPYRRPEGRADAAAATEPGRRGKHSDDAEGGGWGRGRVGRRRWPIVTSVLAVLILALGIAAFVSYRWVQGKYYLGPRNGDVAIFQGINSSVAGISLSSPYQNTQVPVAELRPAERTAIQQTVSYNSLPQAQQIVTRLHSEVSACGQAWTQLKGWQQQNASFTAKHVQWAHLPANKRKTTPEPTFTTARPATPDPGHCAPASSFGIAASALPTGTTNTTAATTAAATPQPTPQNPAAETSAATTAATAGPGASSTGPATTGTSKPPTTSSSAK